MNVDQKPHRIIPIPKTKLVSYPFTQKTRFNNKKKFSFEPYIRVYLLIIRTTFTKLVKIALIKYHV